ncbi:uncharacterized protein TNCV_2784131, partial [Trichonephila clavipes]
PRGDRLNPVFALQRHTAPTADVMGHFSTRHCSASMARVSQDCLPTVTTPPWPARSPDLSPFEHIWDHLGCRVGYPEFERTRGKPYKKKEEGGGYVTGLGQKQIVAITSTEVSVSEDYVNIQHHGQWRSGEHLGPPEKSGFSPISWILQRESPFQVVDTQVKDRSKHQAKIGASPKFTDKKKNPRHQAQGFYQEEVTTDMSYVILRGAFNSRRAANPLVRLVEGEERWEASDLSQGVLPINWGETELNRSVTCMVLKATANNRRHLAL